MSKINPVPEYATQCNGPHCDAFIVFLESRQHKSGRHPVELLDRMGRPVTPEQWFDKAKHRSHFESCPDAPRFRNEGTRVVRNDDEPGW